MIRSLIILSVIFLFANKLLAQDAPPQPQQQTRTRAQTALPPPLLYREVSGIVKDSKGQTVIAATVTLTSRKDTIQASTNEDGIFIFKNVKLATFVISIKSIGFEPMVRRYLNNDAVKRIILDPIELKSQNNVLKEVVINGTPTITYKTDTIEYRASDYKVRENATLDELLKKMEGMEVGSDGTLTHQGQQVMKARVNGKDFAGGDVAQAIQNLPADIVEKIQVVDDYGDQAGRTGIKDGDPTKVLNITTKADRSVGNIIRATASAGNDDRYDERLFVQRLNGNQQLGIIANYRNTVNGVASSGITGAGGPGGAALAVGSSGGTGGTTTAGGPSFNYRDQWSKAIQVNGNYRYSFNDVNSINNSTGQFVTITRNPVTGAQTVSPATTTAENSTSINNSKTHTASFEFEYAPDSANFLRVTPTFSYTGNNTSSNAQKTEQGYLNQFSNGLSSGKNTTPSYGAVILYQYIFKKPKRNISLQVNVNNGNQQQNTEQNTDIQFRDANQNPLKDSIVHKTIMRGNVTKDYRASLTYVEPLTKISQLEFHAQTEYRDYNNVTVTDSIAPNGNVTQILSQSNVYTYSFTNSRLSLNYRLTKPKYNLSIGVMGIPSHLDGRDISVVNAPPTSRYDFFLIPLFRFQYQWSRTHQISINYSGAPTEPSFTQIQPVPDVSDPQNIVFGNPDLSPSFKHTVTLRYNNYIPNDKINLSTNIVYNLYDNQIVNNAVTVIRFVGTSPTPVQQTYFVNISGTNTILANYNISKQSNDRAYNFALNGTVNYGYQLALSNGVQSHLTSWDISNRFGPRINPNTSLEINPFVSYEISRSFNTLPGASSTDIKRSAVNLEGKFYLGKDRTLTIEYNLSKNYINGLASNITKNPFVANAYLEKEFFKRKNGILRVSMFDIFNQNNFINHQVTNTGFTDTKSNALSRYVLVSFVLNLQKWSGTPRRNGQDMKRRGDGSFIYN